MTSSPTMPTPSPSTPPSPPRPLPSGESRSIFCTRMQQRNSYPETFFTGFTTILGHLGSRSPRRAASS